MNDGTEGHTQGGPDSEAGELEWLSLSDVEWLDEHSKVDSRAIDAMYDQLDEREEEEEDPAAESEVPDEESTFASDDPLSLSDVEWLDGHSYVDRKAVDVLYEQVKERLEEEAEGSTEEPGSPGGSGESASDNGGGEGAGDEASVEGKTSSSSEAQPRATKEAKELADDEGLDLADVEGTGKHGKIKLGDVKEALAKRKTSVS